MMISRRILILVAGLLICEAPLLAQYSPKSGRAAIYQRSLDVQARMNVLAIALRPGYEDLATLAYLRFGKGAQITTLFVTNAEGGESDHRGQYPNQVAADRRAEATAAMSLLDGGALFLNMPDIVAAPDSGFVRTAWQADTLRERLVRVISDLRPDVILVARDWLGGVASPQRQVLEEELLGALRWLASGDGARRPAGMAAVARWSVGRVLVDDGTGSGARVNIDRMHPIWKKPYKLIALEAGKLYTSIATQRKSWLHDAFGEHASDMTVSYRQLSPQRKNPLKQVDQDLPGPLPPSMAEIGKDITTLTTATVRGESKIQNGAGKSEDVLFRLAKTMYSIDQFLRRLPQLSPEERKIGLQWKFSLENLRVALLGVVVRYTIDETVLTEKQIALLQIDTVTGIRPGGRSYLYFPTSEEKGWVINESYQKQVALEFHTKLRLLTPAKLEYHLPGGMYGLQRSSTGTTFPFYVIHEGAKPEESFMARVDIPVKFAPRFVVEMLSPVVRVIPGELLPLRITNNSRDGVRDSINVDDSLATSPKKEFRLNTKGGVHLDTLVLRWNQPLSDGTYSVPVNIAGTTVGAFAARQFDVRIDTSKHVALFTGIEASPTADALRRLGMSSEIFRTAPRRIDDLAKFQVVVIDRRALTLEPSVAEARPVFEQFIQRGGHLLILAQDAKAWNAQPLIDDLVLKQSTAITEEAAVDVDSSNRLLVIPNLIQREDWTNWLFQRAYNDVSGRALETATIPVKTAGDRSPLIVQWKRGTGNVTYTDLAFQPQFLNVHAGVYRLLANLLAY